MDNGPGICANYCTLRDGIATASRGDIITFQRPGIIALASGPLQITKNLQIRGAGVASLALDGQGRHRVLQVESGVTVEISDLTIQNGMVIGDNGGGVVNLGTLTLTKVNVTGNTARPNATNEGGWGGGILNRYRLTLANSMISDNRAAMGAGLVNSAGSLPPSAATTTKLTNVMLTGNSASTTLPTASAGGIWNDGTLIYGAGTISDNSSWFASALFNAGTATLANVDFLSNRAGGSTTGSSTGTLVYHGGAVSDNASWFAGTVFNVGTATLTNVEFSGNRAGVGYVDVTTPRDRSIYVGIPPSDNSTTSSTRATGVVAMAPAGTDGGRIPPAPYSAVAANVTTNATMGSGSPAAPTGAEGGRMVPAPRSPVAGDVTTTTAMESESSAAPATTIPASGSSCWPDRTERVAASPTDDGGLQVDVAVTGGGNQLVSLSFLANRLTGGHILLDHALAEQPSQSPAVPPFTVSLPPGTTTYTFVVQRAAPDLGAAASFVVVDSCGEWPAFVGGGRDAL